VQCSFHRTLSLDKTMTYWKNQQAAHKQAVQFFLLSATGDRNDSIPQSHKNARKGILLVAGAKHHTFEAEY